jgi:hypothetical protein
VGIDEDLSLNFKLTRVSPREDTTAWRFACSLLDNPHVSQFGLVVTLYICIQEALPSIFRRINDQDSGFLWFSSIISSK